MIAISKRLGMITLGAMVALAISLAVTGCDSHRCNCPRCPDNRGALDTGDLPK